MNVVSIRKSDAVKENREAAIAYIEKTIQCTPPTTESTTIVHAMLNMAFVCVYEFVNANGVAADAPCVCMGLLEGEESWSLASPWLRKGEATYQVYATNDGHVVCPSLGESLTGIEAILDAFIAKHHNDIVEAINKIKSRNVDRFTAQLYAYTHSS